ncbi:MAG TPA: sugar phosphate isomerase/epimerase [Thermoflexia bacterium]|nr:sugar phosphate isomerase/epimerase [Thermoflexia bacterium]
MTKLKLGVIARLEKGAAAELQKAHELQLPTCQVVCWNPAFFTEEIGDQLIAASEKYQVKVTTIWTGYPGPAVWNFAAGPTTIGLVPPAYRPERVAALQAGADFAAYVGAPSITTHVGFIPETPHNPLYPALLDALHTVISYCDARGIGFYFETGQETPVTLLRVIEELGYDNLGVNFDPANLLMYGKANPLDALDILGRYVRGVHAKDGDYPSDGLHLGPEKPLGAGRVNFPALISQLKALGYTGALTIEREISGPQQIADIQRAIELLTPLL